MSLRGALQRDVVVSGKEIATVGRVYAELREVPPSR